MEKQNSPFEQAVRKLEIPICSVFKEGKAIVPVSFDDEGDEIKTAVVEKIAESFPLTIGQSRNRVLYASGRNSHPARGIRAAVLFSGGPAAGGHNVLAGLKGVLGNDNTLLGVKAGPKGLVKGELFEISKEDIDRIMNTGGFDFLGSDRTKIKSDEQFNAVLKTCKDHRLDGIVIIGGDDSNTNAALLAETLYHEKVRVIGVPKTIDGDLQAGRLLPISFGFDTATKVYSELAGNILQDTPSSRKYWHFIKVMGRAASHVALEVGLQTRPAVCLISEEVEERRLSLADIVEDIARTVIVRAERGINHGVVVVPEGLIEFVPEIGALILELNEIMARHEETMNSLTIGEKRDFVVGQLKPENARLFASFPDYIEEMLLLDRDAHGNLQVSQIPTEQLLIDMVSTRVKLLDASVDIKTQKHFFGYEGRCGAPSLFDASYTFNLGLTAGSLLLAGKTGYIAAFTDFQKGGRPLAIPLTGLLNLERRQGKDELVIEKALVKTDSPAFRYFAERRGAWAEEDLFSSPGPRQLWGPTAKQIPISVALNQDYSDLHFSI